ncbi:MAG: hypothetical protein AABY11_02445 [archaeon]
MAAQRTPNQLRHRAAFKRFIARGDTPRTARNKATRLVERWEEIQKERAKNPLLSITELAAVQKLPFTILGEKLLRSLFQRAERDGTENLPETQRKIIAAVFLDNFRALLKSNFFRVRDESLREEVFESFIAECYPSFYRMSRNSREEVTQFVNKNLDAYYFYRAFLTLAIARGVLYRDEASKGIHVESSAIRDHEKLMKLISTPRNRLYMIQEIALIINK